MNKKWIIFFLALIVGFGVITTATLLSKPDINKTIIFRLMK